MPRRVRGASHRDPSARCYRGLDAWAATATHLLSRQSQGVRLREDQLVRDVRGCGGCQREPAKQHHPTSRWDRQRSPRARDGRTDEDRGGAGRRREVDYGTRSIRIGREERGQPKRIPPEVGKVDFVDECDRRSARASVGGTGMVASTGVRLTSCADTEPRGGEPNPIARPDAPNRMPRWHREMIAERIRTASFPPL